MIITDFMNVVLSAFYPTKCMCCGRITDYNEKLCPACAKQVKRIDEYTRCKFCGKPKDKCCCKRYVYRFCEICSVYLYEGELITALKKFKFYQKPHYYKFFAQQMALCINNAYADVNFDAVAYVPMKCYSQLKRGYNQSKLLAKFIARRFNLPLFDGLTVNKSVAPQHKSKTYKERQIRSRNKYICKDKVSYKNILLIDDVFTTGATLDDCTRALMFSGAEKIYCATAFATAPKTLEKKKKL